MVLREFVNPPEKYGEVSFFWWHGDKIEKEKLHWILEQLKDKGIAGIQLNYCHSDKAGFNTGLLWIRIRVPLLQNGGNCSAGCWRNAGRIIWLSVSATIPWEHPDRGAIWIGYWPDIRSSGVKSWNGGMAVWRL